MLDRQLFRQSASSRARLYATIGFGFLGGGLAILQAWLVSITINQVFLHSARLSQVAPWLIALLGIMALRGLVTWGGEVTASAVARRVKQDLREAVFDHLLALGPAYTHSQRTGELTATLMEGVEALEPYFSQYLPQLATAALVPLTILIVIFPLDWLSAVVLALTAPLIPLFMILIGKTAEALTRRQYDLLGRLSAHFLDTLQGLTTLKLFGQSQAQAKAVGAVSDQYRLATLRVLRVAFLSALILEMVATLSTAIVAVEVGLRLVYNRMEFLPALFILMLAPEFYLPLRMLGARFHAATSGVSAAKRLFEILAVKPMSPAIAWSGSPPGTAGPDRGRTWEKLKFEAVYFSYADRRHALQGASFEIPAKQKTVLVGPSGAGKSTVAHLLLRFAEPERGAIWVGERRLREIDLADWRSQIAWVPQAPHLFHDTIAANLRLACPEASDEAVWRAAQQAHLHDFVVSLPHGYATPIGEGGARLSAGQAQRLALARAFLKEAPFLILDEPTSNVDPELEMLLQDATDRVMQGRTTLVIAHRLSTLYQAEQIIVLRAGGVVESGRHAALWRQQGLYAELISAGWS